jgi:hypothetical protein
MIVFYAFINEEETRFWQELVLDIGTIMIVLFAKRGM